MTDYLDGQLIFEGAEIEDAFSGGGHTRTAKSLANIIHSLPAEDMAIGLEGKYGSGKSFVIDKASSVLAKAYSSSADYRVFTFDLWTHQAESFRRSYLEEFLAWSSPGAEDLLTSDEVKKFRNDIRDRTVNITSERIQRFHPFAYFLIVFAPLLPLILTWASPVAWDASAGRILFSLFGAIPNDLAPKASTISQLILTILYLAFVVVFLVGVYRKKRENGSGNSVREAFEDAALPFKADTAKTEHQTQVIREEDPSTLEFHKVFRSIVSAIKKRSEKVRPRKLVLVFDNIDRLSTDRIPQVWAEMRSIFSANDLRQRDASNHIIAIVPYDLDQIEKAFSSAPSKARGEKVEDSEGQTEGAELVSKTFVATVRVAPPVAFDSRSFFSKMLEKAKIYSQLSDRERWQIFRLYELTALRFGKPPTPRQIIAFINKFIVVWNERRGDLPATSIALYTLRKSDIDNFPSIIHDVDKFGAEQVEVLQQPDWEKHLAAIYYNVSLEHVSPFLMDRELELALVRGNQSELLKLSKRQYFEEALVRTVVKIMERHRPEEAYQYGRVLAALNALPEDHGPIGESWRLSLASDPYSFDVVYSSDYLRNLAIRISRSPKYKKVDEAGSWFDYAYKMNQSRGPDAIELVEELSRALEVLTETGDVEALRMAVEAFEFTLNPESISQFILEMLKEPKFGGPWTAISNEKEVEAFSLLISQAPSLFLNIFKPQSPKWYTDWMNQRILGGLRSKFSETLGAPGKCEPLVASFRAGVDFSPKSINALDESRSTGDFVALFKWAAQNEKWQMAATLFEFECRLSNELAPPNYENRTIDGLGTIDEAKEYFLSILNSEVEEIEELVQEISDAAHRNKLGEFWFRFAMRESSRPIYVFIVSKLIAERRFVPSGWSEILAAFPQVVSNLDADCVKILLQTCVSEFGQPEEIDDVSLRISFFEAAERFKINDLYPSLRSENDRIRGLSAEDWEKLFEYPDIQLRAVESRAAAEAERLSNLGGSARIALKEHILGVMAGEKKWVGDAEFYDPLYMSLGEGGKKEFANNLSLDICAKPINHSKWRELSEKCTAIVSVLDPSVSPEHFIRNVVLVLLQKDPALLRAFASSHRVQLRLAVEGAEEQTKSLLVEDLKSALAGFTEDAHKAAISEIAEDLGVDVQGTDDPLE